MQEVIVYVIVAVALVWAARRIYHNVKKIRRGQNVCNGCGGACGGCPPHCDKAEGNKKNHEF